MMTRSQGIGESGSKGTCDAARAGFSLVEVIVVMVIVGALSVALSGIISAPVIGYHDLARRTELVDLATQSAQRMKRDLRASLPNSIRVLGSGLGIECLHALDGGRYRLDPGTNDPGGPSEVIHTTAADWLSFGGDTQFNVLTRFQNLSFTYGASLTAGTRLAIYSTGSSVYSDAASGTNPGSITPSGTTITISDDTDEENLTLDSSFTFAMQSPTQRVFVVEGPITYLCDTSAGTLTRYSGYSIASTQPSDPSLAPLSTATASLVSNEVESCTFTYAAGTPQRASLVTIAIALADSGERVRQHSQVHVDNVP